MALFASIAAVGIISEILAMLVLYHHHAASWTGPFVVSSVIALVGAIAVTPAVAVVSTAQHATRRLADRWHQDAAETHREDTPAEPPASALPGTAEAG